MLNQTRSRLSQKTEIQPLPIRKLGSRIRTAFLTVSKMVEAFYNFFSTKNWVRIWLVQLKWRLVFVSVSHSRDTLSFVLSRIDYLLPLCQSRSVATKTGNSYSDLIAAFYIKNIETWLFMSFIFIKYIFLLFFKVYIIKNE